MLVATDIAARGVHVDDVELVVHVDPPVEHKAYLHRSGRTARAGNAGDVVTVVLPEQRKDTSRCCARPASASLRSMWPPTRLPCMHSSASSPRTALPRRKPLRRNRPCVALPAPDSAVVDPAARSGPSHRSSPRFQRRTGVTLVVDVYWYIPPEMREVSRWHREL